MDEITLLDKIDYKIIDALIRDGRISMIALGKEVGLSKTPVTARVKRLEKIGVITGYRAELSSMKLGMDHVAFVEVKLSDTREAALKEFNQAIRTVKEVVSCNMIAGGFDYLIKVRTRDIMSYRAVLGERISSMPHVASTSTYVSMESVIDHRSVFENGN